MWSTTPLHRWELTGAWPDDAPPDLPSTVESDGLQLLRDGDGPLVHRIYRTRIVGAAVSPEELMGRLSADLDSVAPSEFATFQKLEGEEGELRVGDEYVVRMPGPWDGPVQVVAVDATSFRLATLTGHLEAGQIEFRALPEDPMVFEIESWARSADGFADLLYHKVGMAKEIQLHMWISFLEGVAGVAGGRMTGGIDIDTRRVDDAYSG
jgi:Domain of unknown function (DUF1990)